MRLFYFLVVIVLIISCSRDNNKESASKIAEPFAVLTNLDSINFLIDSAVSIYEAAILDAKGKVSRDTIVFRYEERLMTLSMEISTKIDNVSKRFISENKSQSEYEEFMQGINLSSVRNKSEELSSYGIVFKLSKD